MKLNLINLSKLFSFVVVTLTIIFFLNIILTNFFNWPGSKAILSFIFLSNDSLKSFETFLSFIQFSLYLVSLFFIYIYKNKIVVNLETTNNNKPKNGIKIPICFPKNFKG